MARVAGELPVAAAERTFTWWDFASLWISLVIGIPNYYSAGCLVELGMTWWQGVATVFIANAILLVPLLLTSAAGARHGISFPILARAAFGVNGAQIPTSLRALVACGWSGINTWIGGQALLLLVPASPSSWLRRPLPWLDISAVDVACFTTFLAVEIAVLWRGMEGIRKLGRFSAPILAALTAVLFFWTMAEAGGLGAMLSPVTTPPAAVFWALFFPGVSANMGTWSTVTLNVADFTRYSRSQADQISGQMFLPFLTGGFAFVGLAVTSASAVIFGSPISDPLRLVSEIIETCSNGVVGVLITFAAVIGISLAVVTTTVPASVVAAANVLVDIRPSLFSFRSAAVVTLVAGAVVFEPWRVYRSSSEFLNTWLLGYSTVTGTISGIMLTDYYVVRRSVLDVEELYSGNPRRDWKGYNVRAMVALVVPVAAMAPGFLRQVGVLPELPWPLRAIYDVSWFFGFFCSSAVYWVLSSSSSSHFCSSTRAAMDGEEKLLC